LLFNETDIWRKIGKGNIIAKTMQNYSLLPCIGVCTPCGCIIYYFPAVMIKERKRKKEQRQQKREQQRKGEAKTRNGNQKKKKKKRKKNRRKQKRENSRANSEFLSVGSLLALLA